LIVSVTLFRQVLTVLESFFGYIRNALIAKQGNIIPHWAPVDKLISFSWKTEGSV